MKPLEGRVVLKVVVEERTGASWPAGKVRSR